MDLNFPFSTEAIASFMFECGISTRGCRARTALRMRVSMSEIGSVIVSSAPFAYQLDFVTPGISPCNVRSRKQIRHIWNLRMKPRARPQRLQRLRVRIAYFGFLRIAATQAVVAIALPPP